MGRLSGLEEDVDRIYIVPDLVRDPGGGWGGSDMNLDDGSEGVGVNGSQERRRLVGRRILSS